MKFDSQEYALVQASILQPGVQHDVLADVPVKAPSSDLSTRTHNASNKTPVYSCEYSLHSIRISIVTNETITADHGFKLGQ